MPQKQKGKDHNGQQLLQKLRKRINNSKNRFEINRTKKAPRTNFRKNKSLKEKQQSKTRKTRKTKKQKNIKKSKAART